jgi:hypothetical protein
VGRYDGWKINIRDQLCDFDLRRTHLALGQCREEVWGALTSIISPILVRLEESLDLWEAGRGGCGRVGHCCYAVAGSDDGTFAGKRRRSERRRSERRRCGLVSSSSDLSK